MRKRTELLGWLMMVILLVAGCGNGDGTPIGGGDDPDGAPPQLATSSFTIGLNQPIGFEAPNDGTGRIFIVEKAGQIRIVTQNGVLQTSPFLNIVSRVDSSGSEMGLLGLAFHPNFSINGLFYVHYTRSPSSGQIESVISEFTASPPNTNTADSSIGNEEELLVVQQPSNPSEPDFTNHKGGQLAFGPDNLLYIGLGDGGSGNDPFGNGQSTDTVLGKILRAAVDPFTPAIDNPFFNRPMGDPTRLIYAWGFRNPWRFSFDRANGRLFAGDVGQNAREEVDIVTRGGNYGWNIMEGSICRPPTSGCNTSGLTLPINDYDNDSEGTAVIGGYVYRGSAIPALVGTYVFGDLSSGRVWGLKQETNGSWTRTQIMTHNRTITAFGQDVAGELYMVDFAGEILRLVAATP
jgi:glucose/arabinose dehydrogenase